MKSPWAIETSDPWLTERERAGSAALIRIIDLKSEQQFFRTVPVQRPSTHEDLEAERQVDGMTLIWTDRELEHEERMEIIRRFDRLWLEAQRQEQQEAADKKHGATRAHGSGG